jgi:crotonobetainyl-CoA hydratase
LSGILYREDGHVARVTIDRPGVLNALDGESETELRRIWDELEQRGDIWAVVLSGAGERAFCVGADMSVAAVKLSGLEYWAQERPGGFGGIACRRTLDIPVIAAVNGYALGGGMEMALGCDIVVAAEEARFGLPEPRVGRIPLDGGVFQLVRQLPHHLAMGLLLTGRQIGAAEARDCGLVNEVVPRSRLAEAVDRWLEEILRCAPLSLRAIKQMVQRSESMPPPAAMRTRFPALVAALGSRDAEEGVRAFQEKRAPIWRAE